MAKRIVKFRLITYFDEVPSNVMPNGDPVLVERTASMGAEVDLRDADVERLDSLGALYTEDEAKAIGEGSYRGPDRELLASFRGGQAIARPAGSVEEADGEHGDAASMDATELADYIRENRLNAEKTVSLAGDDEESIQKVIDAENIATDNSPRVTVIEPLEKKLLELGD